MRTYAPFALIALFGVAAFVFADTSPKAPVHLNSANSNPRFTIHGDGDNRLLLDCQTGETWAMRTVLDAALDADPEPVAVWFPVPQADSKLSESIIRFRLSQLEYMRAEQLEPLKDHLAQQEEEYSSDHPRVVHAKKELQINADFEADADEIGQNLLPLFDR